MKTLIKSEDLSTGLGMIKNNAYVTKCSISVFDLPHVDVKSIINIYVFIFMMSLAM